MTATTETCSTLLLAWVTYIIEADMKTPRRAEKGFTEINDMQQGNARSWRKIIYNESSQGCKEHADYDVSGCLAEDILKARVEKGARMSRSEERMTEIGRGTDPGQRTFEVLHIVASHFEVRSMQQ